MVVALLTVERWMVEAAVPEPMTTTSEEEDLAVDFEPEVEVRDDEPAAVFDAPEDDAAAEVVLAAAELSALDEGAALLDAAAVEEASVEVGCAELCVVVGSVVAAVVC